MDQIGSWLGTPSLVCGMLANILAISNGIFKKTTAHNPASQQSSLTVVPSMWDHAVFNTFVLFHISTFVAFGLALVTRHQYDWLHELAVMIFIAIPCIIALPEIPGSFWLITKRSGRCVIYTTLYLFLLCFWQKTDQGLWITKDQMVYVQYFMYTILLTFLTTAIFVIVSVYIAVSTYTRWLVAITELANIYDNSAWVNDRWTEYGQLIRSKQLTTYGAKTAFLAELRPYFDKKAELIAGNDFVLEFVKRSIKKRFDASEADEAQNERLKWHKFDNPIVP